MFYGDHQFDGRGLGAAAPTGVCPVHPAQKPRPSATAHRLQTALRDFSQRAHDPAASVQVDGLVGPKTVKAVNYVVPKYTSAPASFSDGRLTHAQVAAFAPQLAAFIENAPRKLDTSSAQPSVPSAPPLQVRPPAPSSGGVMPAYPPYYQPQPAYYPQQPGYYPPRGPGGMNPNEASVDTKVFIPAQYEHVKFNPGTVALVIGVGVIAVMVGQKRAESKGK